MAYFVTHAPLKVDWVWFLVGSCRRHLRRGYLCSIPACSRRHRYMCCSLRPSRLWCIAQSTPRLPTVWSTETKSVELQSSANVIVDTTHSNVNTVANLRQNFLNEHERRRYFVEQVDCWDNAWERFVHLTYDLCKKCEAISARISHFGKGFFNVS